nr:hypothetical protein [Tanacetum cinerariifolium]
NNTHTLTLYSLPTGGRPPPPPPLAAAEKVFRRAFSDEPKISPNHPIYPIHDVTRHHSPLHPHCHEPPLPPTTPPPPLSILYTTTEAAAISINPAATAAATTTTNTTATTHHLYHPPQPTTVTTLAATPPPPSTTPTASSNTTETTTSTSTADRKGAWVLQQLGCLVARQQPKQQKGCLFAVVNSQGGHVCCGTTATNKGVCLGWSAAETRGVRLLL